MTKKRESMLLLGILTFLGFLMAVSCIPEKYEGVTLILPRSDPPASSLLWSPANPDQLLITAINEAQGHTQVYILDITTMDTNPILDLKPGDVRGASWSPDGKRIVIAKYPNTEADEAGIWIWNVDKHTSEYVAEVGDFISWSPSEDALAVFRRPAALYLIDTKTKEEELIFSRAGPLYTFGLSWSPNSQRMIFSMGDFTKSDLYLLEVDTGEITQISSYGHNAYPAWSPVGDLIAYSKHYYSEQENEEISSLYLTNTAGTCDVEIPHTESALSPTWSPDGTHLAMVKSREIYMLDLDIIFGKDIYEDLCR